MRPDPTKAQRLESALHHLKKAIGLTSLLTVASDAEFIRVRKLVTKHVDAAQALLGGES